MKSNIYIKKADIANQQAVENLKKFCNQYEDTGSILALAKVLEARKKMLTGVANVYIEHNQDKLFEATVEEIELIESFFEEKD